ncbi:hypothetical protein [Sulfobacillus harzensis]|uniref:Uncharacterized protein n=1 Tax=Sulfobacillus harzensis TaxID=2729629 RepID=A0A7Y0L743_9FIRM|nr:hypothetical protein [Sulfobacillus harzensis]NMP24445.1 hypothetical protein [Sulfobacillus harzensis]
MQRYLEAHGFTTVGLSNLRRYTQRVFPPRTVLVPGPRGRTAGPAHDRREQRRRVTAALELLATANEPGVVLDLTS